MEKSDRLLEHRRFDAASFHAGARSGEALGLAGAAGPPLGAFPPHWRASAAQICRPLVLRPAPADGVHAGRRRPPLGRCGRPACRLHGLGAVRFDSIERSARPGQSRRAELRNCIVSPSPRSSSPRSSSYTMTSRVPPSEREFFEKALTQGQPDLSFQRLQVVRSLQGRRDCLPGRQGRGGGGGDGPGPRVTTVGGHGEHAGRVPATSVAGGLAVAQEKDRWQITQKGSSPHRPRGKLLDGFYNTPHSNGNLYRNARWRADGFIRITVRGWWPRPMNEPDSAASSACRGGKHQAAGAVLRQESGRSVGRGHHQIAALSKTGRH